MAANKILLVALCAGLSACAAVPTKQQNPDAAKRPVKTSSFLGKNDYYLEKAKPALKAEVKAEQKPAEKKEASAKKPAVKVGPVKQTEENTAVKAEELTVEAVKPTEAEVKQHEEAAFNSDYPVDRHRRKAFSGFTKEPDVIDDTETVTDELAAEPEPETPLFDEQGLASWYGPGFHGRQTANGERFNQNAMTAAHRKYPMGTMLEVTNLENGKSVTVRINDRGPYSGKRIIDLSKAAAKEIDLIQDGVGHVGIKEVDEEE